MDAIKFTDLVNNPSEIHQHDVVELKRLAHQYPYSQIVQLMYAMRLKDSSEHLFNQQLGRTSILTSDRTVLYDLFEGKENQLENKNIVDVKIPNQFPSVEIEKEKDIVEKIEAKQVSKEEKEIVVEKQELKEEIQKEESKAPAKVEEEIEVQLEPLFEESPKPLKPVEEEEVDLSQLPPAERIKAILKRSRKIQEEFESNKKGGVGATNERVKAIRDKLEEIKRKNPSTEKKEKVEPEKKAVKEEPVIVALKEEETSVVLEEEAIIAEKPVEAKLEEEVVEKPFEIEKKKEEIVPVIEEAIESGNIKNDIQSEPVLAQELETPKESEKDFSEVETPVLDEKDKEVDIEDTVLAAEKIIKIEESVEEKKEAIIPIFTIDDEVEEAEEKMIPIEEDEVHAFIDWFKRLPSLTKEKRNKPKEERNVGFKQKIELFDTFVEKLPKIKKKNLDEALSKPTKVENVNINVEGDSLVTETLAKIYIKQGHFDKAMKAYQILKLKYPEKSGFFADRISEIKKLKNNK